MNSFRVNCGKTGESAESIVRCGSEIEELIRQVQSVRADLRNKIVIRSNIGAKLKEVESKLSQEGAAALSLGHSLRTISGIYQKTEQGLASPNEPQRETHAPSAIISENKIPLSQTPNLSAPGLKGGSSVVTYFGGALDTDSFVENYLKDTGRRNGDGDKIYKDRRGNEYIQDAGGTLHIREGGFIREVNIDEAIRELESAPVLENREKSADSLWDWTVDYFTEAIDDVINKSLSEVKIPFLRALLKNWVDTNNISGLIQSANDGYIHGDRDSKIKFWVDGICTNLPDYYNYAYTAITELAGNLVDSIDEKLEELGALFNNTNR